MNKGIARWVNVPVPNAGSYISFVAMCSHVSPDGVLCADLDNICFCASNNPHHSISDPQTPSLPTVAQGKRRKYTAYAPPRVPISSPGPSSSTVSHADSTNPPFVLCFVFRNAPNPLTAFLSASTSSVPTNTSYTSLTMDSEDGDLYDDTAQHASVRLLFQLSSHPPFVQLDISTNQ
jgi:hypothetical protein